MIALWWAMHSLGVSEWIVQTVQVMYDTPRSRVRLNGNFSEIFNINVGVHQGSVLSPLLFIMVMEALSRELRTGCPRELSAFLIRVGILLLPTQMPTQT